MRTKVRAAAPPRLLVGDLVKSALFTLIFRLGAASVPPCPRAQQPLRFPAPCGRKAALLCGPVTSPARSAFVPCGLCGAGCLPAPSLPARAAQLLTGLPV